MNNSWGSSGGGNDPWYTASVTAWIAAGIMPIFASGNSGPDCGTAGSPGDYTDAYSAGAYDIDNVIADTSSRGSSGFGDTKPNLAAPGVDVPSSVNGGGYANGSGTSMAAPHVSGTVALLWSASPALRGDIAATRALLDATAVDTPDDQCGGTDDDNNVFGEGRLNAFATVSAAIDNDPPVATNDGYSTNEDTALTVAAPGVLGNDSDPDGNATDRRRGVTARPTDHSPSTPRLVHLHAGHQLQRHGQLHLPGLRRHRTIEHGNRLDHRRTNQRSAGGDERRLLDERGHGADGGGTGRARQRQRPRRQPH